MERELTAFAESLRNPLRGESAEIGASIANKVYNERKLSLVPRVAALPALVGCLFLSGGMGLMLSSNGSLPADAAVETVSPENSEIIWEKQVKPATGDGFNLTLDLQDTLRASHQRSGRILWAQHMPEIAATSAPLVFTEHQKVFISIASAQGAVYLLNGVTGQVLWMQNLSDRVDVSPLQIKNSVIAVACTDGKIYGMSVADGHIDYMIQTDSEITALEPVADGRGEHIYAIADKKRVLALNAMTGDLQWRRETSGVATNSPILSANKIITPTVDGGSFKLWAFDIAGNLSWMNTFNRYNTLASTEGYIAIVQGPVITLLKAETGEAIHYWQLGKTPADIELMTENGMLIVRTDQGNLTSALN
ncbi:MAG: PQQ-binding-like beta-propeller repeat protein [Spirochaetes bacterium]|nr:PQQ-binding-like beta-propeller repeat protein [Spirochaetota bacterium]